MAGTWIQTWIDYRNPGSGLNADLGFEGSYYVKNSTLARSWISVVDPDLDPRSGSRGLLPWTFLHSKGPKPDYSRLGRSSIQIWIDYLVPGPTMWADRNPKVEKQPQPTTQYTFAVYYALLSQGPLLNKGWQDNQGPS